MYLLFVAVALMAALVRPLAASADPVGSNTEYSSPTEPTLPFTITEGSDGNMWFTDPESQLSLTGKKIGKTTPGGEVTEFSPTGMSGGAFGIAKGPEGTIWFTEPKAQKVEAIKVSEPNTIYKSCSVPGMPTELGEAISYITEGPDGNLWATLGVNGIAKITPACGLTEYDSGNSSLSAEADVCSVTAGPDSNVWFGDCAPVTKAVGKITSSGSVTEYTIAGISSSQAESIALGSDSRLWFPAAKATDERLGAITTGGTVTYYKTPTSPVPVTLTSLTAGPDGNIWAMEPSGENETQKATITATGGTYKLGFEGKETGATGTGDVDGASGTGDLIRITGFTCLRTSGSKELKSCSSVAGVEPGMRLQGSLGIPAGTMVEKVEGTTIFITNAATSGTGSSTTITVGWITNVTTSSGEFKVGKEIAGTGLAAGVTILSLPKAGTITTSTVPTTAGTGIALTSGSKTITNVKTSTGAFSLGEVVSGTGIPASTTITAIGSETLTISNLPTSAGTSVALSADLPYNASTTNVREALEKLSTIGVGNVSVGTDGGSNRTVTFEGKFTRTNVPQVTCDSSKLTGGSCSMATTVESFTNRLFRIIPATGEMKAFPVKPATRLQSLGRANALAKGPGGSVWYASIGTPKAIGKFGTEPGKTLKVIVEGTGGGTVVSNPSGIECPPTCEAEFETGKQVTLTASPNSESLFVSWKGCETGGANGRQCKVTLSGDKTVSAKFITAYDVSVSRKGTGLGKVGSSPGGVLCLSNCSSTSAKFKEATNVTLTATPSKHFTFEGWSGDCTGKATCVLSALSADKSVEAEFKEVAKFDLTVTKTGGGQGTVKAKQAGINCGATCSSMAAKYYEGEVIELLAPVPGKGSTFAGWSGSGCSGKGTCLVTMSSAKSVEAKFE